MTSTEPALPRDVDGTTPAGVAVNAIAWTSGVNENSDGPCGLQKMLDAMTAAGVGEGERNGLLRGLAAILHLGQVRRGECRRGAKALFAGESQRRTNSSSNLMRVVLINAR